MVSTEQRNGWRQCVCGWNRQTSFSRDIELSFSFKHVWISFLSLFFLLAFLKESSTTFFCSFVPVLFKNFIFSTHIGLYRFKKSTKLHTWKKWSSLSIFNRVSVVSTIEIPSQFCWRVIVVSMTPGRDDDDLIRGRRRKKMTRKRKRMLTRQRCVFFSRPRSRP